MPHQVDDAKVERVHVLRLRDPEALDGEHKARMPIVIEQYIKMVHHMLMEQVRLVGRLSESAVVEAVDPFGW